MCGENKEEERKSKFMREEMECRTAEADGEKGVRTASIGRASLEKRIKNKGKKKVSK